jgi:hypothetical protein
MTEKSFHTSVSSFEWDRERERDGLSQGDNVKSNVEWQQFSTPMPRFTNFGFTTFRYDEARKLTAAFHFTNIILATTKNGP